MLTNVLELNFIFCLTLQFCYLVPAELSIQVGTSLKGRSLIDYESGICPSSCS